MVILEASPPIPAMLSRTHSMASCRSWKPRLSVWFGAPAKSKNVDAVVDGNNHDVLRISEVLPVVERRAGATNRSAAVVEED